MNTGNPGHISGPTDMSNALLQGVSEEQIKVEQQKEVGKALAEDLGRGAVVHVSRPQDIIDVNTIEIDKPISACRRRSTRMPQPSRKLGKLQERAHLVSRLVLALPGLL